MLPAITIPAFYTAVSSNNENNNNDNNNSITSISLSVITLFHQFPFLLKLYLTSSTAHRKQDYWYLSEMKVHFQRGLITRVENPVHSNKAKTNSLEWLRWAFQLCFAWPSLLPCTETNSQRNEGEGHLCNLPQPEMRAGYWRDHSNREAAASTLFSSSRASSKAR